MRAILIFLAAAMSASAGAQEAYVTSSDDFDYLILEDTIRATREFGDTFVVAWEKQIRKDKSYRMVLNRYWCADQKSSSVRSIEYSSSGKVLESYDFSAHRSKANALDIIPRTIGGALLNFVCDRAP